MTITVLTTTAIPNDDILGVARYCRVDSENAADFVTPLVPAAAALVETLARRSILRRTYRLSLYGFPVSTHADPFSRCTNYGNCTDPIVVPNPPLVSVESITYVDTDGVTRTLASNLYTVDTAAEPGRVTPVYGTSWPATRTQPNAVQVEFTAGYANVAAIPPALWMAVKMLVASWVTNPDAAGMPLDEQPLAFRTLVASCSLPSF